jgi:microcystin-dependent protein
MAQPYVGEIRMFAGNFAISGWAFCDGALLPISEYETLFTLLGTTYGGDGQSNFGLPDLRGRIPIHAGNNFTLAQNGGAESVTVILSQLPTHTHSFAASSNPGTSPTPSGNFLAATTSTTYLRQETPTVMMNPASCTQTGGSQPHNNIQTFGALNYIIALYGIFPSQS